MLRQKGSENLHLLRAMQKSSNVVNLADSDHNTTTDAIYDKLISPKMIAHETPQIRCLESQENLREDRRKYFPAPGISPVTRPTDIIPEPRDQNESSNDKSI